MGSHGKFVELDGVSECTDDALSIASDKTDPMHGENNDEWVTVRVRNKKTNQIDVLKVRKGTQMKQVLADYSKKRRLHHVKATVVQKPHEAKGGSWCRLVATVAASVTIVVVLLVPSGAPKPPPVELLEAAATSAAHKATASLATATEKSAAALDVAVRAKIDDAERSLAAHADNLKTQIDRDLRLEFHALKRELALVNTTRVSPLVRDVALIISTAAVVSVAPHIRFVTAAAAAPQAAVARVVAPPIRLALHVVPLGVVAAFATELRKTLAKLLEPVLTHADDLKRLVDPLVADVKRLVLPAVRKGMPAVRKGIKRIVEVATPP